MNLCMESRLKLCSLTIHEKRRHYIVEDAESGEFYEMPYVCIEAIRLLENNLTLGEAEKQLKADFPQEEVDIMAFAEQLLELDLVEEADGHHIPRKHPSKGTEGKEQRIINGGIGKWVFSNYSIGLYGAMLISVIALWAVHPNLFPRYTDLFVSDLMVINSVVWLVLSLAIVLVHEWGHYMAVKAQGLTSRLGIGHRLFLVVFETEMNGVWRLPAKKRYVPYLGGLCFDITLLFSATVIRLVWGGTVPLLDSIMALAGLCLLINILYQFLFFMKTDLYYVIENATGVYNLMENSKAWLSRFLPFTAPDGAVIYEGESKIVRWYAWFYIAGFILSAGLFLFYLLPQTIYAVRLSLPKLSLAWTNPVFWDGAVFLLECLLMIGLLAYSWLRKWREKAPVRPSG